MISDNIASEHPEYLGPYFLWRLLIDMRWQRRGYGRAALDLVLEYLATRPGCDRIVASFDPRRRVPPLGFYLRYGFVPTGEVFDDEPVIELPLPSRHRIACAVGPLGTRLSPRDERSEHVRSGETSGPPRPGRRRSSRPTRPRCSGAERRRSRHRRPSGDPLRRPRLDPCASTSPSRAGSPTCSSNDCPPARRRHVAVLLDNTPDYLFAFGGAALIGGAVVGLNHTRRGEHLLRDTEHTHCGLVSPSRATRRCSRRSPTTFRRPRLDPLRATQPIPGAARSARRSTDALDARRRRRPGHRARRRHASGR